MSPGPVPRDSTSAAPESAADLAGAAGPSPAHEPAASPTPGYPAAPQTPAGASIDETTASHPVSGLDDSSPLSVVDTGDGGLAGIRIAIVALLGLAGLVAVATLMGGPAVLGLVEAAILIALAGALVLHQRTVATVTDRRLTREASVTRILQGLSRSVSPESVVDAIVQELHVAAGADHVVVARVRQPDHVVEVTLVTASTAVPISKTWLRPDFVGELSTDQPPPEPSGRRRDPARAVRAASQAAADEIARRVRSAYGLSYTVAAPLVADARFMGALILSKRTRGTWAVADRRLLAWAASELSAAFARAYAHEAAERGANIDALTNLPNRRYFNELLAILRPGRRSGDRTGILMIDIDYFKRLNDRYGHATGDVVLRAVAGAIAATIRAEDTPARYGGEEFVVILRRASAGAAADVGERIRLAVASLPLQPMGIEEPVTVSVGVAVAAEEETDMRAIIERADRALYAAKRAGRDRIEVA
jgi:diguanylate cyclase (GGDEF)-like protein